VTAPWPSTLYAAVAVFPDFSKASKERRLETKERRSRNKQLRQTRLDD